MRSIFHYLNYIQAAPFWLEDDEDEDEEENENEDCMTHWTVNNNNTTSYEEYENGYYTPIFIYFLQ